jgi:hypothetical protein
VSPSPPLPQSSRSRIVRLTESAVAPESTLPVEVGCETRRESPGPAHLISRLPNVPPTIQRTLYSAMRLRVLERRVETLIGSEKRASYDHFLMHSILWKECER